MRITKIAVTDPDQNKLKIDRFGRDLDSLKREYKKAEKDFKSDIKELKKDISEIKKVLKDLNIGKRLFYQHKTVFTSLQRKIEKFEAVEAEWKNFKETIDDKIKKAVEKTKRARVKV